MFVERLSAGIHDAQFRASGWSPNLSSVDDRLTIWMDESFANQGVKRSHTLAWRSLRREVELSRSVRDRLC